MFLSEGHFGVQCYCIEILVSSDSGLRLFYVAIVICCLSVFWSIYVFHFYIFF